MTDKTTLTVIHGSLEGNEYELNPRSRYLIGRGDDCDIPLPRCPGPLDISRHHCLLETTTDKVYIRDLGSLHGTYVNGQMIGQRPSGRPSDLSWGARRELKDGDEVLVGNTVLRVTIEVHADVLEPAYSW